MNELRERLAVLCHEQWSGWMKYLFSKCKIGPTNELLIPRQEQDRWMRQINSNYEKLSEGEKDSDRAEADRIMAVLKRSRTREVLVEKVIEAGRKLAYEIEGGNRWLVEWDDDTHIQENLVAFKALLKELGVPIPEFERNGPGFKRKELSRFDSLGKDRGDGE